MHSKIKNTALLLSLLLFIPGFIPGFTSVFAAGNAQTDHFLDVEPSAWYAEAVYYCREQHFITGTSDTTFSPGQAMSRGMFATVLWRAEGEPGVSGETFFQDVPPNQWYTEAIRWAALADIVSGYRPDVFGPDDPVTREQLVTMLYRYQQYKGMSTVTGNDLSFMDSSEISSWAQAPVQWAVGNGIIYGRPGNTFAPKAYAGRADAVVVLHRYLTQDLQKPEVSPTPVPSPTPNHSIWITVGSKSYSATLQDDATGRAFMERLPMTLAMQDLNQNEKYFYLDMDLPVRAYRPEQIENGDLMLYGTDCLVLFYESFRSSYSYTPIGKIDAPAGLKDALGSGNVTVTFSRTECGTG